MRREPELFADGLRAWLGGARSLNAEAAGSNVAELLLLAGAYMTEGKWGK
jgi:hypothetical protein